MKDKYEDETSDSVLMFANRDSPLPLIPKVNFSEDDGGFETSDTDKDKRGSISSSMSSSIKRTFTAPVDRMRNAAHGRSESTGSNASNSSLGLGDVDKEGSSSGGMRLQDRLLGKVLQQIIPSDNMVEAGSVTGSVDAARSAAGVTRPPFSLPIMTSNFRRFNSRIGVVFMGEANLIDLFSWRRPSRTISFLAVYSFICLDPYLLAVLPIAIVLLGVMVPSFIVRHPPPPTSLPTDPYKPQGPAIAPPIEVKAVSETSKDFFRNMRDLQNSMEDFSRGHDALVSIVGTATNFSDERLSTALFLILFLSCCALFLFASILPWRAMFLVGGWVLILSTHPKAKNWIPKMSPKMDVRKAELQATLRSDILMPPMPELREVEIFELQRLLSTSSSSHPIWEPWLFLADPYAPLSPLRISQTRPRGCRFFEDVVAPKGWEWEDKKWTLDMNSREWVAERMITGVECQVEGERWVFDLVDMDGEVVIGQANADFEAFYDDPPDEKNGSSSSSAEVMGSEAASKGVRRGEWRRRRWIRMVSRKSFTRSS